MITNTLSINPVYLSVFEKTGQPYVTDDDEVFLFLKEEDAENFLKNHPGAVLKEPQYYTVEDLGALCYGAGATKIKVKIPGKEQERSEDLTQMPKKKYYNFPLNHDLNLLHETKKKKYLLGFIDKNFIVPVKINPDSDTDIIIEYSIAKMKDKNYFLAFSNLDEFEKWSEKVKGFSPIEISYSELKELCNDDDCIINIFGARYILTQEKMMLIEQ